MNVRPGSELDRELAAEYGVTRLVLLPVDPGRLQAYWEIADYTWEERRREFGTGIEQAARTLRLRRLEPEPVRCRDIALDPSARRWAPGEPLPPGRWRAELGLSLSDGRFASLVVSNDVWLPIGRRSRPRPRKISRSSSRLCGERRKP